MVWAGEAEMEGEEETGPTGAMGAMAETAVTATICIPEKLGEMAETEETEETEEMGVPVQMADAAAMVVTWRSSCWREARLQTGKH